MDQKPKLFLSSLPVLNDYVTLFGQITTPGPHLLNCACSRALLRKTNNVLSSPAINDKGHVYIVVHKNEVKNKKFMDNVASCSLKLVKVSELTMSVLQCCLDFTIHTYLHPRWTRVDKKYLQGNSCLFQNRWMGCIRAQINVQSESVILALKATQVKLLVARLSTFHIRDDVIQDFMNKEIRTIISSDMGDNTCYVLPSFKPALVHSISYDIDKNCPLRDRSDMMAYWLDYHGMLIPSDTDIFVTLSFNFPGAPTMTYPYYCIRKSFPLLKQGTDPECISDFVQDVNNVLKARLPKLQLDFPSGAAYSTFPDESRNCLVSELNSGNDRKLKPSVSANYGSVTVNPKENIMPQKKSISPIKQNTSATPEVKSVQRIKPRFTPYKKSAPPLNINRVNKEHLDSKFIPNFLPEVPEQTKAPAKIVPYSDQATLSNFDEAISENGPLRPTFETVSKATLSPKKFCPTPHSSSQSSSQKHRQTNVLNTPNSTVSHVRLPSHSKTHFTPRSIPSSFEHDDFDDFEIPHSLKLPSPKTKSLAAEKPTTPTVMRKSSQSEFKKKPKAPPKIANDDEIKELFFQGNLTKVNNQSLSAFLKKHNVKGFSKLKKEQLVAEAGRILHQIHFVREL